jgi:hypothetical protein
MRLRTLLGGGVVLLAVIGAVVVLRANPAPPGGSLVAEQTSVPEPPPTTDARSRQLTSVFGHITVLPPTVRFASDPDNPPGFVFQRYDTFSSPGIRTVKYTAEGSIVRRADSAVLAHVLVIVQQADPTIGASGFAGCASAADYGGGSCTPRIFADGTLARVVRNPAFAQSVATDATAGEPPGLQTELDAAYPSGTRLTVTLFSMNQAGIPLDDAAMLRLVTVPGISSR